MAHRVRETRHRHTATHTTHAPEKGSRLNVIAMLQNHHLTVFASALKVTHVCTERKTRVHIALVNDEALSICAYNVPGTDALNDVKSQGRLGIAHGFWRANPKRVFLLS